MSRPTELFQSLDSREVRSGEKIWRVEVYSIREEGPWLWIQLGAGELGGVSESLVIRAAATREAPEILQCVEKWLASSDRERIRTVEMD